MNFTGQTRKRVVNLGDRPSGLNRNYLQQTKQQRLQREEQRKKEKALATLQTYVNRYLSNRRTATDCYKTWRSKSISTQDEFNDWIVEFKYVSVWHLCHEKLLIPKALNQITKEAEKWHFPKLVSQVAIEGLLRLVGVLQRESPVDKVIQCIDSVLERSDLGSYPGFIDIMSPLEGVSEFVTKSIITVNSHDSYASFLKFLAELDGIRPQYYPVVREVLLNEQVLQVIVQLTDKEKINLLIGFLSCHGTKKWNDEDVFCVANILFSVSSTVQLYEEDSMFEDDLESRVVEVNQEDFDTLKTIYSNSFIQKVIDHFESGQYTKLSISVICSLLFMIPSQKNRLCMLLTITKDSYQWFYKRLCESPIYQRIESLLKSDKDFLSSSEIVKLYENSNKTEIDYFWRVLLAFEELYSYWLIVSNDAESFEQGKLNVEEVCKFLVFAKHLCLTLLFNYSNPGRIYRDFDRLKLTSLSLLNHLYLKNLRLNFLQSDFWKVKNISFNISTLVKSLDEVSDDSDIEEKPDNKVLTETDAKLEILKKVPFFIEFNDRVEIFQKIIQLDRTKINGQNPDFMFGFENTKTQVHARRDNLLDDGFRYLGKTGSNLKHQIQVTLYNEWGQEAGVDGGGLTKEFLNGVIKEGFTPNGQYKLFKETSNNQLFPSDELYTRYQNKINVESVLTELAYLKFLGNIVGKCLYDNVLIDVSFAPFFLNKWCNSRNLSGLNDLNSLDGELFKNLIKLSNMSDEAIEALELNFTVSTRANDETFTFNLIPNGENIRVNSSNRLNYIHLMANFKLNTCLQLQTKYFLSGVFELVSSNWLKMFDFNELQMLISGSKSKLNLSDWRSNVEYGGYWETDATIRYFWEVVEEMSSEDQAKLLKFVTSVARAPLLGFKALSPKFGIRNSGISTERLPTASTCVNLLKLPDFRDKEILRQKLLFAINADAGFDLS